MTSSKILKKVSGRLVDYRRVACETVGIARYSRPARDGLEAKLAAYLPERGTYLEAGAFDGFRESNTYYLERIKGWRGILVEPVPGNYQACLRLRPASTVFHAALVAPDHHEQTVSFIYRGLMTSADYIPQAGHSTKDGERVTAPARTLSSILDEAGSPAIDFMSLDLEGGEPEALRGLDLHRHRPSIILVECRNSTAFEGVMDALKSAYSEPMLITRHDYLFRIK